MSLLLPHGRYVQDFGDEREACRLPGLIVSGKELMRHTDIVNSYSSMSTFFVVVKPACRNLRKPVVIFPRYRKIPYQLSLKAHHYPVRLPSIWSSYLIVLTLESVPASAREQQRSLPRYKRVPVAYPEVQSRRSNSAWHLILTFRVVDARGSERILVWQRKGLLHKVHQVRASGFDSRLFDACQHQ
jgi:hypothetical protein